MNGDACNWSFFSKESDWKLCAKRLRTHASNDASHQGQKCIVCRQTKSVKNIAKHMAGCLVKAARPQSEFKDSELKALTALIRDVRNLSKNSAHKIAKRRAADDELVDKLKQNAKEDDNGKKVIARQLVKGLLQDRPSYWPDVALQMLSTVHRIILNGQLHSQSSYSSDRLIAPLLAEIRRMVPMTKYKYTHRLALPLVTAKQFHHRKASKSVLASHNRKKRMISTLCEANNQEQTFKNSKLSKRPRSQENISYVAELESRSHTTFNLSATVDQNYNKELLEHLDKSTDNNCHDSVHKVENFEIHTNNVILKMEKIAASTSRHIVDRQLTYFPVKQELPVLQYFDFDNIIPTHEVIQLPSFANESVPLSKTTPKTQFLTSYHIDTDFAKSLPAFETEDSIIDNAQGSNLAVSTAWVHGV